MNTKYPLPNFIRNAWLHTRRDKGLTLATVLIMTLTVFITEVFAVVSFTANFVLKYLESRPQITVFYKNDFAEDKISSVAAELKNRSDISSVNFISKEDAYKFYLGQHSNEQNLLESVSSDIFPPALEIKSQDISNLAVIADQMSKSDGVDEVVFFKDIINTFKSWVDTARLVGLVLILILVIISLFIILVTVGMTIRSRGEEIEIIKLLGATDWYIRLPFLVQGAIYGFVSGFLSTLALLLLTVLSSSRLEVILSGIAIPPLINTVLAVSGLQLLLGVAFGAFGAWLSTKRYLRV